MSLLCVLVLVLVTVVVMLFGYKWGVFFLNMVRSSDVQMGLI